MTVTLSQNPPILGKNNIKIEIKDSLGEPVTDASPIVNYFMPPMPGMPPMNYKVKATPDKSEYNATMDLIMEGPWNITVMAKVAGKRLKMTVLNWLWNGHFPITVSLAIIVGVIGTSITLSLLFPKRPEEGS